MKHLFLWIKMIIYYPSFKLSLLHVRKDDIELNQYTAKVIATILLRLIKVKAEMTHKNHIPLEDGHVFIARYSNDYEATLVLAQIPVDVSFVFGLKTRLPYMKTWFKRIQSQFVDLAKYSFVLQDDQLNQLIRSAKNLFVFINDKQSDINDSFYHYCQAHQKTIIPVVFENSKDIMIKGNSHVVTIDVRLPLHHEEYRDNSIDELKQELQNRML